MKLNSHKPEGLDVMHLKVLRELIDTVAKLLYTIFGKPCQSGKVLSDWKKRNIIPIFKKGKKEDPGKYIL